MRIETLPGDYDWANHEAPASPIKDPTFGVQIDDETLRDGLQGGQVETHPSVNRKKTYLSMMSKFGYIDHADIAIPGSNQTQLDEASELINYTIQNNLPITLSIAGRGGNVGDIDSIITLANKFDGYPLEVDIFLDPTKLRAKKQKWDRDEMIGNLKENIKNLKANGLKVMFVPERSTSAPPDELLEVCQVAADLGVDRLCIADTEGVTRDTAIKNIFRWSFDEIGKRYPNIKWDFHEHNDRGLGLGNCITATEEGVDRLHATSFCIGERTGNVDILLLIYNLWLEGYRNDNLINFSEASQVASRILDHEIPVGAGAYGKTAYDLISGIHTDTELKELEAGESTSTMYFISSPEVVGRKINVRLGPASGKANAIYLLEKLGFNKPEPGLVQDLLDFAKEERRILYDNDILARAKHFYGAAIS